MIIENSGLEMSALLRALYSNRITLIEMGCRSMSVLYEKMGKNVHVDFMIRNMIVRPLQN